VQKGSEARRPSLPTSICFGSRPTPTHCEQSTQPRDLHFTHDPTNNFPIIQYADDTILIMTASQRELFCLKGLLQSFSDSTGLKVNYAKSQIIPLNLAQEQAMNLANAFGCQLGTLPFTYLGLPLGTTKPKVEDYMPLMDKTVSILFPHPGWETSTGPFQHMQCAV
jgi:hypothetical protein